MRRFFLSLFVISLIATGASLYWRTFLPEAAVPASQERSMQPQASPGSPAEARRSARDHGGQPSERQDLAVMISIVSSVISAVAAVAQTWLTARSIRH